MNKFKYYVASWATLLAAFHAIVFVCAKGNFSTVFWIGYAFIVVAFIGQLVCAYKAFAAESLTKKIYNIPVITESYAGLILMLIFGSLFMAIPGVPIWPGVVICVAILTLSIIAVMKASANADIVESIDKKVADETAFMKNLTREAEALISRAKSEEVKAECVKVYEAVRYAPKRSSHSTPELESEIGKNFDEFKCAVIDDNAPNALTNAKRIYELIQRR